VIAAGPSEPPDLYTRLLALNRRAFDGIASGEAHLRQMTRDSLDPARSAEQLATCERLAGISLRGKRVLEIGAGTGLTVAVAREQFGAEAFGVEPGSDEYEGTLAVARSVLAAHGLPPDLIEAGVGEALPYEDASFDVVVAWNVLEHVSSPARVVAEALRVLRPGGILHVAVPNYGSWWEGHYGILWPPNLPRPLAKLYVRLLGRDPAYIDTLRLVHRGWLERIARRQAGRMIVLDWGQELWVQRVRSLAFSEWAALGALKRIVDVLHRLRLVSLVIWVGRRLHWETPLILTARKVG
jgi:SAM-dependent methyltransferase